jgi:hypothetical protein
MTIAPLPEPVRMYNVQSDDYCVAYEIEGEPLFELRAEDPNEPETRNGRGIRIRIGNRDLPLDWFRAQIDQAMPWLTGKGR